MNLPLNFIAPEFCDTYKFLLVEELVLRPHPALLHYGYCTVIGYLEHDGKRLLLGSLSLLTTDDTIRLPDLKYSIIIELMPGHRTTLPTNTTVEVHGEVMLRSQHETVDSRWLMKELGKLQGTLEEQFGLKKRKPTGLNDKSLHSGVKIRLQKRVEEMKSEYLPVVRVHTMNKIGNAKELILMNLKLRRLDVPEVPGRKRKRTG